VAEDHNAAGHDYAAKTRKHADILRLVVRCFHMFN